MFYTRKNKGLLRMPRWKLLKWVASLGILIQEHVRPSHAFTADFYWQQQQQQQTRRRGGAGLPFNCRRSAFEVCSHSTEAAASGNAPLNDLRRRHNSHHESLLMGTLDSRASPPDNCVGEESSGLSGKKGFGAWVRSRRLPFRDRHRDRQGDPTVISSHIHHQQHPSVEQLQHSATELKASSLSFIPEPEVGQGSIINWEDLLGKFHDWYIDNHRAIGSIQDEKILERAFKFFLQSLQEVSSYTADQLANDVFILKKILDSEIVIPGLVGLVSTTNFFNDQVEPLQPIVDSMTSPTSDKLSKPVLNSLKDDSFVDVDETAYRTMVENALYNRLSRWTDHMRNVNVQARPRDRFLYRSLLRMTIESDLRVDFDRLAFPNLKISAGGRIDVNGCSMSVPSILPHIGQIYSGRRFVRPFEFHATNCTLTQDDVLESPCIINGLQTLLNRILQRYAYSTAKVETVQIIDSNEISCVGFAKTAVGVCVPFEVRSGLSVSGNGHVLKFPGLEIAFGPFRKIFMPVIPTIDVDIGANAKIESLEIHGMRKMIKISARATVSPEKAMTLFTYRPKRAPETIFKVDVGDFVTNLGNFDK